MGTDEQVVHRPGFLKQSNKKHKSSKSSSRHVNKGRTDIKALSYAVKKELNKIDRRHQANQIRKNKRDVVIMKKRGLGSSDSPPILVAILAVNGTGGAKDFLNDLKNCDDMTINYNKSGYCHMNSRRLKQRFTFMIPNYHDIHAVMDMAKVADTLLFIHSQEAYDEYTEKLFSLILSHACPSTVHIVRGMNTLNPKKKSDIKKEILKRIESRFPNEKLCHADTTTELQLLLRHVGSQKQKTIGFREIRSHLLAEELEYECLNPESQLGTLKITGYVRGQPLNVNKLIYIPGWGNFQMSKVVYETDPHPVAPSKKKPNVSKDTEMRNSTIDEADPLLQESLQSEIIPNDLDAEQTWPTEEELNQAMVPTTYTKRVVEGTSDYQAGWIIDSDNQDDEDHSDDSDQNNNEDYEDSDAESMVTAVEKLSDNEDDMQSVSEFNGVESEEKTNNYDEDIDMEEEEKMRVRFREERTEHLFPDEIDTPIDVPARIRYQKFRGLKDFSSSKWDPMENLPLDYARIYRFENFKFTRKNILKAERTGAPLGSYITVHITNVPTSLYDAFNTEQPLAVFELLPHEQKMSVMNVVIKKHPSCKVPIKSKDELIFHVGFRRFTCKPIFSAHHAGNKFKYERFLPSDAAAVASFYAPVTFPSASVTILRRTSDGDHELVATGSLLDINPKRIAVKRIVLSGHMFKIFKKSATVRYMFFDKEDIYWFKKVELKTKYGIRGEIREALGSHGHMKCKFQKQLPSQDVVLMALYKRVFPKWTYDPYVSSPSFISKDIEAMLEN